MNQYHVRGAVALLVNSIVVLPCWYFQVPVASTFPIEAALLVWSLCFFWRPIYAANGLKLGVAMQSTPSIAFGSLIGPCFFAVGALASICLRSFG